MPDGAYTFSSQAASGSQDWVVRVTGAHRDAIPFVPTGLRIDDVDVGHLAGPGWYSDERHVVFLTNAGPFTVSGSTTAGIGIEARAADTAVTLDSVRIDASAWDGSVPAFRLAYGASVAFTLVGESTLLTADGGHAALQVPEGASATIDGEGALRAVTKAQRTFMGASPPALALARCRRCSASSSGLNGPAGRGWRAWLPSCA